MTYPNEADFRIFINVLQSGKYTINKYLPAISEDWYTHMFNCMEYIVQTTQFLENDFYQECARILYKIVKSHSDLVDSNKRSSVIGVILFCLVNDHIVLDPQELKNQAKRIAKSKGRENEEMICERVAKCLRKIIVKS